VPPPLKTEKRKLPGFPTQSVAGWAGIPTSPPVRGPAFAISGMPQAGPDLLLTYLTL